MRHLLVLFMLLGGGPFSWPMGPEDQGLDSQFDFFIGHWETRQRWMQEGLTFKNTEVRVHAYKVLNGMGMEDDNFTQGADGESYMGTAIRTYQPGQDRWECRWFNAADNSWSPAFYLKKAGKTMTGAMTGSDKHGAYTDTITFYDIGKNHFSWKMDRVYEGLDKVFEIGRIEYTRVKV